jgi:hypothetical protein
MPLFNFQKRSGENDGVQAAMSANGVHKSDRHQAQAAEVLLRRLPAKRRAGDTGCAEGE